MGFGIFELEKWVKEPYDVAFWVGNSVLGRGVASSWPCSSVCWLGGPEHLLESLS